MASDREATPRSNGVLDSFRLFWVGSFPQILPSRVCSASTAVLLSGAARIQPTTTECSVAVLLVDVVAEVLGALPVRCNVLLLF